MKKNKIIQGILWLLEGVIVGFGAIMPGVSGGALCVAFGMYKPLIGILSDPKTSIKKYWKMLGVFLYRFVRCCRLVNVEEQSGSHLCVYRVHYRNSSGAVERRRKKRQKTFFLCCDDSGICGDAGIVMAFKKSKHHYLSSEHMGISVLRYYVGAQPCNTGLKLFYFAFVFWIVSANARRYCKILSEGSHSACNWCCIMPFHASERGRCRL